MAYDFYGPWDKRTGHNAPLFSYSDFNLASASKMWEELGMPKEKLVIGVPSYGHSFRLEDPTRFELDSPAPSGVAGTYTRTDGFFAYYEVCEFLSHNDTIVLWDEFAMVPFAFSESQGVWVSFDNEYSLRQKVNLYRISFVFHQEKPCKISICKLYNEIVRSQFLSKP